jgi:hypothetical protein
MNFDTFNLHRPTSSRRRRCVSIIDFPSFFCTPPIICIALV